MNRTERVLRLATQNSEANNEGNTSEEAEVSNALIVPDSIELNIDTSGIVNSVPCDDVLCPLNDVQLLPSSSSSEVETYRIEHNSSTKLKLRKIAKPIYHEQKEPSEDPENEEELWGEDSDEYVPSESETSSNDDEITDQTALPSDSQINTTTPKKGKKGYAILNNGKKTKAKLLKNAGKRYTSKSGKIVKERAMRPPCLDKCILKCSSKLSDNSRTELFNKYWNLGSLQRQRDFLASYIEPLEVKYRRLSMACQEPRKPNCAFYLMDNGKRIRVYKTYMINTFGITERTMRTVIKSKVSGSGIVAEDKRGRHGKHAKIDQDILDSVKAHINGIPRIESHYQRANTSREFIDGVLSIAEMHRHYTKAQTSMGKPAADYNCYARIFNTQFNIGFFFPKKDLCDFCEGYKNAQGAEKEKLENNYQLHQEEKKLSRTEKAADKEKANEIGSNMVLATYDLQAVLPVSMGQSSAFFYKSRLNCFNFTISEINKGHTICYFWHEGIGQRGAVEIGSCVLHFVEEVASSRPGSDIVFYSDNCCGQQKNRYVFSMYLYVVETLQINSITHKFLIRGHTQNEGDTTHSIIEKSMKRAKKSGPIYVPDQLVTIIRNSKKKEILLSSKK